MPSILVVWVLIIFVVEIVSSRILATVDADAASTLPPILLILPPSIPVKPEDKENIENEKEKKYESKFRFKRYKIQEVIKPNQVILVQVIKDERGQKGAALSTFISIAGKYIVLMPNTPKGGGISRKIFNPADRKKIRSILNEIEIPKEMGLIVRTAGSNKTKNEINHDLDTLINNWNQIKENALSSIAPSLIHQESEIIKRTLRDMYDENTKNIIIEGNEGYKKAQNFMKMMMPSHVKKIKKYRGKIPLFIQENIDPAAFDVGRTTEQSTAVRKAAEAGGFDVKFASGLTTTTCIDPDTLKVWQSSDTWTW